MARRKYHQSREDRRDESRGMKKYYQDYPTKESRAGHRYNESAKHHRRESEGMKRYWHEHSDDAGHAHRDMHRERRHNSPMRYGSSNHGNGGGGPQLGRRIEPSYVAQHQEHWGCGCGDAMRQHENGSMDYLSDKNEIMREDDRRLSREMLPQ